MNAIEGSNFLGNSHLIAEGDTVIVYVNQENQYAIVVKRGVTLHMKYGALRHEFLIGKRYGTPISATAGYVQILRANPHLWTRTLQKKTQILYTPDIATILLLLDAKPGARICETGTGSGSLTHALATAVAPTGHVYSHDIDGQRVSTVREHIKTHGLSNNTTLVVRDACKDGFEAAQCDSIFLDLPCPWLAIDHCKTVLQSRSRSGRVVSFSPCIEQVQRVAIELERLGFVEIETIELLPQKLKVINIVSDTLAELASQGSNPPMSFEKERNQNDRKDDKAPQQENMAYGKAILDATPFPTIQPTHTGYLTSATLLPIPTMSL